MDELLIDKLQVLALCLEIMGITLTFLHIFKNDFSNQIASYLKRFIKWSGIYVFDYGTYDPDDPLEISGFRELFKIIFGIIIFFFIDLGNGFLWGVLEYIVAFSIGMIVGIIFQMLFAAFFALLVGSMESFGKGDLIAGIGLSLTFIGIIIEIIQVLVGSLSWSLLYILGAIILIIWTIKIVRKPSNDPWDK